MMWTTAVLSLLMPPDEAETVAGDLIVRTINALDDATPNANGTMVSNLMQLYLWTGEERYRDRAEGIVRGFSGNLSRNVFAHTGLLTGALPCDP
jgi:uncharacterized protein YyaL (SSP411 family)